MAIDVRRYRRKSKWGGFHIVRSHPRRKKMVGKTVVKRKRVGTFTLLFDKYGNIKGSQVSPFKK